MRIFSTFLVALLFLSSNIIAQETKVSTVVANPVIPKVSVGTIKHYENFESKYFTPHNIDVWLPDGYDAKNKYAVLYMHDGKGLFDSSITWNKKEWMVDENMTTLLNGGKIRNTIVVGIWNGDKKRHAEYFPQKPFESFSQALQDSMYKIKRDAGLLFNSKINSDSYLKFLVKEVKPFIDKNYATLKNRDNTFIAGSSMGGLISLYAMCEYPNVFDGAACLSTHWPGVIPAKENPVPAAFLAYLQKNAPSPKTHKLYFDYGTISLDYFYKPLQIEVDKIFLSKGFTSDNYLSKEFTGEGHSEIYWSKRLDIPLLFLLKK